MKPVDSALILIAEDDPEISAVLDAYLLRAGWRTVIARDGSVALDHARTLKPDLILLDVGLPKHDGFDVLSRIRREGDTPIIMVTAMSEDVDRLTGLRMGADDYVVKPFNPQEVVERVRAVLRRAKSADATSIRRCDPLELDLEAQAAFLVQGGARMPLALTLTEFRLLAHMATAPTRAYARAELIDACMPDSDALDRTVDSHLSKARRKLEAAGVTTLIQTVRGVGYRLADLT